MVQARAVFSKYGVECCVCVQLREGRIKNVTAADVPRLLQVNTFFFRMCLLFWNVRELMNVNAMPGKQFALLLMSRVPTC